MSDARNSKIPWSMHRVILYASGGLGAVGIPGAFAAHADVPVIATVWAGMFCALAVLAGKPMDKYLALKVAGGLLLALSGMIEGIKLANTYFAASLIATPYAVAANMALNAGITYNVGRAAARIFLLNDKEETADLMIVAILSAGLYKLIPGSSLLPTGDALVSKV